MKKLLLITAMVFSLVILAGCNENQQVTGWIMGGADLDNQSNPVAGRIGLRQNLTEFGLEINYLDGAKYEQTFGAYALVELTPDPNGMVPYIGGHFSAPDNDLAEGGFYGPIGGTFLPMADNFDTILEYRYVRNTGLRDLDENDEHQAYAGIRYRY